MSKDKVSALKGCDSAAHDRISGRQSISIQLPLSSVPHPEVGAKWILCRTGRQESVQMCCVLPAGTGLFLCVHKPSLQEWPFPPSRVTQPISGRDPFGHLAKPMDSSSGKCFRVHTIRHRKLQREPVILKDTYQKDYNL